MQRGIVKWFNNSKGYGFLLAEESQKDVFVHFSCITMDGYRTLRTGQTVMFEAIEGPKGLHAALIEIVDTPDIPQSLSSDKTSPDLQSPH